MDDLKELARSPIDLFQQFIEQVRVILAEEGLSSTQAMEKVKEVRRRTLGATEDLIKTFRHKVTERERELRAILSSDREDLAKQAHKLLRDLGQIINHWSLRDKLTRSWEDQSAPAMLADYEQALRDNDSDKTEIFEAEAERFFARKGDPQALAQFMALCGRSQDARFTPAQRDARTALEELQRLKGEVTVALSLITSVAHAYSGLVPLSTQWRKHERHSLDLVDQRSVRLTAHREGDPPLPLTLLEFSEGGLRIQSPETFPEGSILNLSLKLQGVTEQPISFQGEVRWCREDPNQPGHYLLGLCVIGETDGTWRDLFAELVNQISTFKDLFSSYTG